MKIKPCAVAAIFVFESVLLVNSTDPNKQLLNTKSVFKSFDHKSCV